MLDYSSTTYGYLTIKQGNAQYKKDIQAIQEELDKQAYHHIIRVKKVNQKGISRPKTIHVWATRPEIKIDDIKKGM